MSRLFARTLRDDPADADIDSHRLLVRGGYIRRMASGVYAWLLTRIMQKHRIPDAEIERKDVVATAATSVPVAHKKPAPDATPAG